MSAALRLLAVVFSFVALPVYAEAPADSGSAASQQSPGSTKSTSTEALGRFSGGEITFGPDGAIRARVPFTEVSQGAFIAFDGNKGVKLLPGMSLDALRKALKANGVKYAEIAPDAVQIGKTICYFKDGKLSELEP